MRGKIAVDVGECLEVSLRMGRGGAGCGGGGSSKVTVASAVDFHRLIDPFDQERIRFFLMPFEPSFFTVDPEVEVVFLPNADLGAVKDSLGPVVEAQQDVRIVVQQAALDKSRKVCGEFADFQPSDVLGEVLGMGSDIADAAGRT